MATSTGKTYQDSSGKTFSSQSAAASSNTSLGTNPKSSTFKSNGSTSSAPAYNAATGATTGASSPEYDAYLKSLNHPGSANFVPVPGEPNANVNAPQVGNPAINTAQPSPTATNIAPPNTNNQGQVSLAQAQENLNKGGLTGGALAGASENLKNHYQQGFNNAQANGVSAPDTSGQGSAMVKDNLPNTQQQYTPAPETQSEMDKAVSTYTQAIADFQHPDNQRKTLVQEYDSLSKSLNYPGLQAELLDVNRIMDGTEDDIRSEVTAAGGFATDSQVQAMTIGRNKSLLKKAQYITDQLTAAKDQLSTMMQLTQQDRQFAEQRITTGLQMSGNLIQIQQSMHKASQDNYTAIVNKQGYDGLLAMTGNNPYNVSLVEKTMGLQPGGLQQLATMSAKDRATADANTALDTQYKKAQIANTYSQINERNNPSTGGVVTLNGKPQNASQSAANGYADRLNESNVTIDTLGSKFAGTFSQLPMLNFMKSGDRQAFEAAKTNFVTAVLRRESGASISPTEFANEDKKYFPQPGDKPSTVAQKEAARNTAINNIYREANVNRPVMPGMIIESNGVKYKVGSDGVTLEKI